MLYAELIAKIDETGKIGSNAKQGSLVEITCPKCSKDTTFNVTEAISCSHCQTSFQKIKFAKKAVITAWTALMVGGIAGHKIDDFLEPNRYPATTEYALIESCTKGLRDMSYQRLVTLKFEMCACALVNTQKAFNFKRYDAEPLAFASRMRTETLNCISN